MEKNPDLQEILDRIPRGWGKGLDIGPGWYPIVAQLNKDIRSLYPDYKVHQVKEKFGGLRYYCEYNGETRVEALIRAAEEECDRTCESCGTTDNVTTDGPGWITTRCGGCRTKPTQLGQF